MISRRAHAERVCPRNGESIHHLRFGCALKRLHDTIIAIRYQDGMIDDAAYERERDAIRAKLTTASTSLPFAVAALVGDFPAFSKRQQTKSAVQFWYSWLLRYT